MKALLKYLKNKGEYIFNSYDILNKNFQPRTYGARLVTLFFFTKKCYFNILGLSLALRNK